MSPRIAGVVNPKLATSALQPHPQFHSNPITAMNPPTKPTLRTLLVCLVAVVSAAMLPSCISVSREVKEPAAPTTVREVRTSTHAPVSTYAPARSSTTTTVTSHR